MAIKKVTPKNKLGKIRRVIDNHGLQVFTSAEIAQLLYKKYKYMSFTSLSVAQLLSKDRRALKIEVVGKVRRRGSKPHSGSWALIYAIDNADPKFIDEYFNELDRSGIENRRLAPAPHL